MNSGSIGTFTKKKSCMSFRSCQMRDKFIDERDVVKRTCACNLKKNGEYMRVITL